MLVQDSLAAEDPQAGARVTLLGTVEPESAATAREAYVARHPRAAEYVQLQDFGVWRLKVTEVRYVNGFGDMGWLTGEALQKALAQ